MIGKVTFPVQGRIVTAVLRDDRSLACTDPDMAALLQMRLHLYRLGYSTADGPFGVAFLNELAREYGGRAVIEPKKENPNAVY